MILFAGGLYAGKRLPPKHKKKTLNALNIPEAFIDLPYSDEYDCNDKPISESQKRAFTKNMCSFIAELKKQEFDSVEWLMLNKHKGLFDAFLIETIQEDDKFCTCNLDLENPFKAKM